MCIAGGEVRIKVINLLLWLYCRDDRKCEAMLWGVLFHIGVQIDNSKALAASSTDALYRPNLTGPKGNHLKIDDAKKTRIANLAAAGAVFKSPASVVHAMSLLSTQNSSGASSSAAGSEKLMTGANKWTERAGFQYLGALQEAFFLRPEVPPVYSLTWDATRLSKKDTLLGIIYNDSLEKAGLAPLQVPHHIHFLSTESA